MDQNASSPAEALAEIQRTQRSAYAHQHLPIWYTPAFIAAVTLLGIGTELHGAARSGTLAAAALVLGLAVAGLSRTTRVRWRARTWTLAAGAEFGAWVASIAVVMGVTGLAIGAADYEPILQRAVIGLVGAAYSALTLRWIERRVLARTAGKVVR
ncbi:hypothetical protein [Actinomadura roseirufa]|uniref:hypothetical protein n=1 Tax=Actinomadura roseirufa TaxID=2094049 RepID=UPI0010413C09|nr:hypothetical protein [Actinomadura roseirufa]